MPDDALQALALLVGVYGATVWLPVELERDLPTVLRELVVLFDAIKVRVKHRTSIDRSFRGRAVTDILWFKPQAGDVSGEAPHA